MSMFRAGGVVRLPISEVQIESFDGHDSGGREIYTVISAEVKNVSGYLCNRFKAAVVPTLTIIGVDPQAVPLRQIDEERKAGEAV